MGEDSRIGLQTERADDERAKQQAILAAESDLLEATKAFRAVENDGHWEDMDWWDALYRVRDIADRLNELENS